jgi:serine/threonine-protein kinase HipA
LLRESQFIVRYNDEALKRAERAISLTMPPRPEGWKSNQLPPALAMNLPEGFLRQRVIERFGKVMEIDDMNLLAVTSTRTAGRVWASIPGGPAAEPGKPLSLRDILAHRGTEALFDELLERYATSPISGVQPKVVVPERAGTSAASLEKSAAKSPDLIVKSAGADYPGLAENEYICMSIARHAGLETPAFWLSEDRKLFVIRRFDMGANGYLGFEDLAALTGRHPQRKYDGSYADVAKAIGLNVASIARASSLEALFRLMVVNCLIRNGDAHLKNFGVLYGDPGSAGRDARIAPVYDLISSTVYIRNDVLALSMGGSKAWPGRRVLERFGKDACELQRPARIIDEVIERAMAYRHEDLESPMWKKVRGEMETGAQQLSYIGDRRPI